MLHDVIIAGICLHYVQCHRITCHISSYCICVIYSSIDLGKIPMSSASFSRQMFL